jgi:starch phosphorylase
VNYTNHTILPEALEKWQVNLMKKILPRHIKIIQRIDNELLLSIPRQNKETNVEYKKRVTGLSVLDCVDPLTPLKPELTEEFQQDEPIERNKVTTIKQSVSQSEPSVNMANLCVTAAHRVNGVAALHTDILKREVLATFHQLYPLKFQNKTNGVTPRRWLAWCNPDLSKVITKWLGNDRWLKELNLLEGLKQYADDPKLQKDFCEAKISNKNKLAQYIEKITGYNVPTNALYDVQIKRIHEYKRQLLNLMGIIYRYKKNQRNDA